MKNILFFLLVLLLLNGCKVDNFPEPNVTISGRIIDAQTNNLVESGGSNGGSVVKFYQGNSTQAQIFTTFPDGTFTNSREFASSYRYVAEGPFQRLATDTPTITVNAIAAIDIKVTPNVRLTASVLSQSGTTAIIKVTYEKVPVTQTLVKLGLVWSNVTNPNIFTFTGGNIFMKDVQSMGLTSGFQEFSITGLKTGTKYYVRASAATNAPGNYYNYSTQIVLQK